MAINEVAIPIVLFVMVGVTAIGLPLAKAYARRLERDGGARPTVSPDVTARLERMEQAIDSIAVEVERISEGQRFTTKLLAERANAAKGSSSTEQSS